MLCAIPSCFVTAYYEDCSVQETRNDLSCDSMCPCKDVCTVPRLKPGKEEKQHKFYYLLNTLHQCAPT